MDVRSQARLRLLKDYYESLSIAFGLSVVFAFTFLRRIPVNKAVLILVPALTFGTGFFLAGAVRSRIRLRSFILDILAHTALICATLVVCAYAMIWFSVVASNPGLLASAEALRVAAQIEFSPTMLLWAVPALVGTAMINGFFQISRKMGPGVLRNWMTGKYHTPREETLIFMFLDMKDSTTLAEQLGAIQFSALVRDFFFDLTFPLEASKGKVSHYIGDEAVIYWSPKDGLKDDRCLAFFFDFQDHLRSRATYYAKTYGLQPEFKAGIHLGPVVATEVGDVKSEIVFHGDVLNTAARIQSMCNETGCELLISQALKESLTDSPAFAFRSLGAARLKGKAHEVELFAVERRPSLGSPPV